MSLSNQSHDNEDGNDDVIKDFWQLKLRFLAKAIFQ